MVLTAVTLSTSCSKETSISTNENTIVFSAESDVELNNLIFIDRNKEIIWQESINTQNLNFTKKIKLKQGDKIWIRSIPSDGEWHLVKTSIHIDGIKLEAKEKFCVAGTGCTHVFEN